MIQKRIEKRVSSPSSMRSELAERFVLHGQDNLGLNPRLSGVRPKPDTRATAAKGLFFQPYRRLKNIRLRSGTNSTCPFDRERRRSAFHVLAKNADRIAAFIAS